MSATATWSTKAALPAAVAGAAALALGVLCVVHAAVTLALAGAPWNLSAHVCMVLAGLLAWLRLRRTLRRSYETLHWDPAHGFRVPGMAAGLVLERAWQGPAWVTLRLRPTGTTAAAIERVVWKSVVPAPLWSELALRIQADTTATHRPQNKDNP